MSDQQQQQLEAVERAESPLDQPDILQHVLSYVGVYGSMFL
jgi:hypothetical protein